MPPDELIRQVRDRISGADSVTVLTGAGISADSGVPTFRGPEGLWRNFRAEDLATPGAFSRDPKLVWEWYDWRRALIASKSPNAGHRVLAEMEDRISRFALITQNVDGLHARAGNRKLIEIHGNIWKTRCLECGAEEANFEVPLAIPPHCRACGGLLRPGVVWFGESLDPRNIKECMTALENCQVMLVIGTSGVVQPAASFAGIARSAGAFIAEVNPDPAGRAGPAHAFLEGRAAEVLPALL